MGSEREEVVGEGLMDHSPRRGEPRAEPGGGARGGAEKARELPDEGEHEGEVHELVEARRRG